MLYTTRTGKHVSEGMRALWAVIVDRKLRQSDVARALKAQTGSVTKWLHGDQKPGRTFAKAIEENFGVDAGLWDEPLRRSIPALKAAG